MRLPPIRALLAACFVVIPSVAVAQLPLPQFSVVGGVSHFDLSGTGSTPIGELRVNIPLLALSAEGSFGVMRPSEDNGTHTYIVPEAQLQYPFLPLLVKPYVGVGGGYFKSVSGPEPRNSAGTFSVSAGVRIAPPLIGIGLRGEVRYRGIGSNVGSSTTDFTVGISF
ncbi:MAG TPA: hypothetical protein VGL13_03450 [Polyangiaceae bacterium]|jgi:hypothetical protein